MWPLQKACIRTRRRRLNDGANRTYYARVESYREGGKLRERRLRSFGTSLIEPIPSSRSTSPSLPLASSWEPAPPRTSSASSNRWASSSPASRSRHSRPATASTEIAPNCASIPRPPPTPSLPGRGSPRLADTRTATPRTLAGTGTLTLLTGACSARHPGERYTPALHPWVAAVPHTFGLDVTALVGFLRFGWNGKEREIGVILRGDAAPISPAPISRHSAEFLVRWPMFSEERLLHRAPQLRPFVLQIDGTWVEGGPVTFRVREARSGVTRCAHQIVAESLEEAVPVLVAFQARFGDPALIVRDDSATRMGACDRVFPGVPQQVDHFHFLTRAGERLRRRRTSG